MIDVGILLCCAVVRRTDGWGLGPGVKCVLIAVN